MPLYNENKHNNNTTAAKKFHPSLSLYSSLPPSLSLPLPPSRYSLLAGPISKAQNISSLSRQACGSSWSQYTPLTAIMIGITKKKNPITSNKIKLKSCHLPADCAAPVGTVSIATPISIRMCPSWARITLFTTINKEVTTQVISGSCMGSREKKI